MPGEQDQEAFYDQLTSNLEVCTTPLEGSWPRTRLCRKQAGPRRSTLVVPSLPSVLPITRVTVSGAWDVWANKNSRNEAGSGRPTIGPRPGFGSPMNCGQSCNRCSLSLSMRIALVAGDHVCLIGAVLMRFSTCCAAAANGKPWPRPNCVHIRRPTI